MLLIGKIYYNSFCIFFNNTCVTYFFKGNLLVNSQTGMLEIQNRNTVTTTSNQIVLNDNEETQIESIEMIQR